MDLYAQDNDLESDESTKKANQIFKNIDMNKILSEIDESNRSHQIHPEQNFFNDLDIEISSIEAEARVQIITEENEADSNFTTILNGSLDKSDFPDLEYVVHQMEIR
jgi:ERCC4-related helicase